MKKSEIKLGVVYAYQRGEWDTPSPLVFLSLDLYTTRRHGSGSKVWCEPASSYDTRPKRGAGFGGRDVGYPVVMADAWNSPEDMTAAMTALGAEVITDGLTPEQSDAGLSRDILTRMASITGLYADVVAERERLRQEDRDQTARREAERAQDDERIARLTARLAALGVTFSRDYRVPGLLTLTLDDAEAIARRLEG
jgi:hypothetical protein